MKNELMKACCRNIKKAVENTLLLFHHNQTNKEHVMQNLKPDLNDKFKSLLLFFFYLYIQLYANEI